MLLRKEGREEGRKDVKGKEGGFVSSYAADSIEIFHRKERS